MPSRKKLRKIESTIKVGGKEGSVCKHCWKKHDDREVWEKEGKRKEVESEIGSVVLRQVVDWPREVPNGRRGPILPDRQESGLPELGQVCDAESPSQCQK